MNNINRFVWHSLLVLISGTIIPGLAFAEEYEIESCQYAGVPGQIVPPGLDESLNCDHKCFYDELGIDLITSSKPTLQELYSIGWRLVQLTESEYRGRTIWTVYVERKKTRPDNECQKIYAPRRAEK